MEMQVAFWQAFVPARGFWLLAKAYVGHAQCWEPAAGSGVNTVFLSGVCWGKSASYHACVQYLLSAL